MWNYISGNGGEDIMSAVKRELKKDVVTSKEEIAKEIERLEVLVPKLERKYGTQYMLVIIFFWLILPLIALPSMYSKLKSLELLRERLSGYKSEAGTVKVVNARTYVSFSPRTKTKPATIKK